MKKIWNKIKIYFKPFANWKFLISFGIAWMITNGWCYLFILFGSIFQIGWMFTVGMTYAAFLYLPFTLEKLITIPMAMFFQSKFFPKDLKLKKQFEDMKTEVHQDLKTLKFKAWCYFHRSFLYSYQLGIIGFDKRRYYETYRNKR